MEQQDRAAIDRFCEEFYLTINMCTLWPRLIENKVFNRDDVNVPLWKNNLEDQDTVRDILLTIKTRGPHAFNNLARSLRQTDQHLLADILQEYNTPAMRNNPQSDNDSPTNNSEANGNSMDDTFHTNLRFTDEPLQINVQKAKEFCDGPQYRTIGIYRMRSRPRGYVLIITMRSYILKPIRKAAEHDEGNLKKLFEDMGFEVTSMVNLTGAEMKRAVKEFSRRNFTLTDSCFVIISAHGSETLDKGFLKTTIEGVDHGTLGAETVFRSDIMECFTAQNCPLLVGKPKVFIFQSCRGEGKQKLVKTVTDGYGGNIPPRNYSDTLVAHSSIPGYVSYRNAASGSWYIQILCEVFMNYASKWHLLDLFSLVDRRLASLRAGDCESQTSTFESIGFNKHCYLNPGLFEDS